MLDGWQHAWIPMAMTSALCQTVRAAALKDLNRHVPILVATWVRFVFGLPFLATYALCVVWLGGEGLPRLSTAFVGWTALSLAVCSFGGGGKIEDGSAGVP